eukprot:6214713-Pleurochrysis_carterae.AAC.1
MTGYRRLLSQSTPAAAVAPVRRCTGVPGRACWRRGCTGVKLAIGTGETLTIMKLRRQLRQKCMKHVNLGDDAAPARLRSRTCRMQSAQHS